MINLAGQFVEGIGRGNRVEQVVARPRQSNLVSRRQQRSLPKSISSDTCPSGEPAPLRYLFR
jgi:hypothetical protein